MISNFDALAPSPENSYFSHSLRLALQTDFREFANRAVGCLSRPNALCFMIITAAWRFLAICLPSGEKQATCNGGMSCWLSRLINTIDITSSCSPGLALLALCLAKAEAYATLISGGKEWKLKFCWEVVGVFKLTLDFWTHQQDPIYQTYMARKSRDVGGFPIQ